MPTGGEVTHLVDAPGRAVARTCRPRPLDPPGGNVFQVPEPPAPLHAEWLASHHEWGPGSHEDRYGLRSSDDVTSPAGFFAWVLRLVDQSDRPKASSAGRVPVATGGWSRDGRLLGALRCVMS